MNLKELHKQFRDNDSPSVEGQYRWLEKQGFTPDQIEQAIIETYTEIHNGHTPQRWTREMKNAEGKTVVETRFGKYGVTPKGANWKCADISNGFEFDQFLLEMAKSARKNDLQLKIRGIQIFEKKMRKKWAREMPWYKRMFGIKPEVTE